jgi:hypothetical protein
MEENMQKFDSLEKKLADLRDEVDFLFYLQLSDSAKKQEYEEKSLQLKVLTEEIMGYLREVAASEEEDLEK